MKVVREGATSPSEPKTRFTGGHELDHRLNEQCLAGMRVATARFTDGGRTFWHRHHGEQVLYVLSGEGCVEKEGEKLEAIEQGDVVYVAPGEKHWHGAQPGHDFVHLAVTTGETEWEEEVDRDPPAVSHAWGVTRARKWEHTGLAVADLACAIEFYRQALGYRIVIDPSDESERIRHLVGLPTVDCELAQLHSPISPHVLELLAFRNVPQGSEEHGPTRPGTSHVSFVVEDVEAAVEAAERLGASRLGDITCFPDGRRVYCRDPSGTAIEMVEYWRSPLQP